MSYIGYVSLVLQVPLVVVSGLRTRLRLGKAHGSVLDQSYDYFCSAHHLLHVVIHCVYCVYVVVVFNMLSETAEPTAIDSDFVGTTAVLGLLSMALLLPKFLSLGHGTGHREMEAVPSAHT